MSESEDAREVLNIPTSINTRSGLVIEVRQLSAIAFLKLTDRVIGAIRLIYRDPSVNSSDGFGVLRALMVKDPELLIAIIAPATNASIEQLGSLDLDEFASVMEAFIQRHRRVAQHFLDLGKLIGEVGKDLAPISRKQSIRSSAQAIPTNPSESLPGANSELSEEKPQPAI